jgi:hypothetical protein
MEYVDIICNSRVIDGFIVTTNTRLIEELLVQLYAYRGNFVPSQIFTQRCPSQNRCYSMVTHLILRIVMGRYIYIDYDTCGCSRHHAARYIKEVRTELQEYIPNKIETIRKNIANFLYTRPYKGYRCYKSNVQHMVSGDYKQIKLRSINHDVFRVEPVAAVVSRKYQIMTEDEKNSKGVVRDKVVVCTMSNGSIAGLGLKYRFKLDDE